MPDLVSSCWGLHRRRPTRTSDSGCWFSVIIQLRSCPLFYIGSKSTDRRTTYSASDVVDAEIFELEVAGRNRGITVTLVGVLLTLRCDVTGGYAAHVETRPLTPQYRSTRTASWRPAYFTTYRTQNLVPKIFCNEISEHKSWKSLKSATAVRCIGLCSRPVLITLPVSKHLRTAADFDQLCSNYKT